MSRFLIVLAALFAALDLQATEMKLVPAQPLSPCLEELKSLSVPEGWGQIRTGRSYILDSSYTLDYQYDKQSKIYMPVLTKIDGDEVLVVTPKGAMKTNGKNCKSVQGQTSLQMLSKWIADSVERLEQDRKSSLEMVANSTSRNVYDASVERSATEYRRILQACAVSDIKEVSTASSNALKKLSFKNEP